MTKRLCYAAVIAIFTFFVSGCALLNTALGVAAAYAVYQATK
ncbi:MAG: hypothetical protein PHR44_03025 [Candidatus Omnitrophica bacterium]|nr:hypothetical protein [Candidatus Omnitrophota bacterium]